MEAKNNTRLIVAHILVWLLLGFVPLHFNAMLFGWPIAIVRVIPPLTFMVILAYGNILGIIPHLFRREGFVWYAPFLAYLVIIPISLFILEYVFYFVNHLTDITVAINFEAHHNGKPVQLNQSNSTFPQSIIGLVVIFILFVSSLYGLAIEFMRRDREKIELKATNLKNELKLLRRQINPHFLFNALNNLYAIVQLKPEKAGEFVLKLSDMLRYVTYDCQNEKVAIDKEIAYLNNYVYFQKWRDQNFEKLDLNITVGTQPFQIEPMLLIPFVENAFKHSYDSHNNQNRWVKIHLKVVNKALFFEVSNSLSKSRTKEDVPDEYMGIGVENVRKRLELLYANKHQLNIQKSADSFTIKLSIQLA